MVATWNKMAGIKGYYVEKYDRNTDEYVKVKTLKASATSYTFSKVNVGVKDEEYRIRPYDSTAVYEGSTITVSGTLAAPTNVKVVKTSNGVQVSWKAVAGADYYRVYRTTNGSYQYDKTAKTYNYKRILIAADTAMKTKEYKKRVQASNEANEVVNRTRENVRRIKMKMHGNVSFLSERYVNPETLAQLLEYLENGRAKDLQEALNLYETDAKHKEMMEANQRLEDEIQMLRNEVASIYIPTTYH